MTKSAFSYSRITALFTLAFFLPAQAFTFAQVPQNDLTAFNQPAPEKTLQENNAPVVPAPVAPVLTTDFLQDGLKLESIPSLREEKSGEDPEEMTATGPSTFEKALDFLNRAKGFAAAVVDTVTQSHLGRLVREVWEYGIAVIKGAIVLFTSHDENRLEVTAGFRKLLDQESVFLAHKQSPGKLDPSVTDFWGAGIRGKEEYLIALDGEQTGAARFDAAGRSERISSLELENKINSSRNDSAQARAEIARLVLSENTADRRLLEIYRSDPPVEIDPDSSDPAITSLPNDSRGLAPVLKGTARNTTPDPGGIDWSNVQVSMASRQEAAVEFNLYNTFSWGWAELNYDYDITPGVENFNFSSVFSNGLVLGLSSPSLTEVFFELTDASGAKSRVLLKGITDSMQKWKILPNQFSGIDVSNIIKLAIGLEGRYVGKTLNVEWGNLDHVPEVAHDASGPAITKLPLRSNGLRASVGSYVEQSNPLGGIDYSGFTTELSSPAQGTAFLDLYNTFSTGRVVISFDDANTADLESVDFEDAFPDDFVLELASDDLTEIFLEATDVEGNRSRILLTGISPSARRFKVQTDLFAGVDMTQIFNMALVVEGRYVGKTFQYKWGNFENAPQVQPAVGDPDLTPLPVNDQNQRPFLVAYASEENPDGSRDYSSTELTVNSKNSASLVLNHFNTTSYGGVYVYYDNPETTDTMESIDVTSAFPDGIVLELESAAGPEVYLILADANEDVREVRLKNVFIPAQKYHIPVELFEGLDLENIVLFAVESRGRNVGADLNVKWGDFFHIPQISNDAAQPDVTPLPLTSAGTKPVFEAYSPGTAPGGGIDYSSAQVDLKSETSAEITFKLYNTFSWGRAGFNYDNPSTGQTETMDFEEAFPDGLVFNLSHEETGLQEIYFAAIDASGHSDFVEIKDIAAGPQTYKLLPELLDEIELENVVWFGFYLEGRHTFNTLTVDWGSYAHATPVSGQAYNEGALTQLDGQPAVTAESRTQDAKSSVRVNSSSEFEFVYDLRDSASAEAAAVVAAEGATLNLPSSLVLAARGTEDGRLRVEVKDVNDRSAIFILELRPIYQNFVLDLSGQNVPAGFDRTQVASLSFAQDAKTGTPLLNDIVKIRVPGLDYEAPVFTSAEQEVKEMLVSKGLDFFTEEHGLHPETHFPYDSVEADGLPVMDEEDESKDARFTQPTLIGFYLQILGEVVNGKIDNGMTRQQALEEIETVLNNLLVIQQDFGVKGLLPWMRLEPVLKPYNKNIAFGDNANLAQSLAVMSGLLQMTELTAGEAQLANELKDKVEEFLDNQEEGYLSFYEEVSGGLYQVFVRDTLTSQTGSFPALYMDRVANEFRAAMGFVVARFPELPATVMDALELKYNDYKDSSGNTFKNLAYYDGSAFQAFWPMLRNNETDFIGFYKALNNAFVTFTDYSARNHLPGFASAAQRPDSTQHGFYEGRTGIRDIAEAGQGVSADKFIGDVGSVYALAAAYSLDPKTVLEWLASIREQIPELEGGQGFFDAARSASEISKRFLGIDVAGTILGLSNSGPAGFEVYLRNSGLELSYNLLYDEMSKRIEIEDQTTVAPASPVELQDKSFALFSHLEFEGRINGYNGPAATPAGVHFSHGALPDGYGGYYWVMDRDYDARAHQLVITYSASNTPQKIKIELKNENGNLLGSVFTPSLVKTATDKQIIISLPNNATFSAVRQIVVLDDQNATNDSGANFIIHSIDFQHRPSFQNILPDSSLDEDDVSTVSGSLRAQHFTSNDEGSLERPSSREVQVNYDFEEGYAGFTLQFNSGFNLGSATKLVFGLKSSNAKRIKIEFEDLSGKLAVFYATDIDVSQNYYEFLASRLQGSVNSAQIKKINFLVETESFDAAPSSGDFVVELLGIPS